MILLVIILLSAMISYCLYKYFFCLFLEYFVLWSVARGGRYSDGKTTIAKNSLLIFICPPVNLDEKSVIELYSFVGQHVNYNLNVQEFHKLLLSYGHAVLYRDKQDGSLRGVLMVDLERKIFKGNHCMVMQCGTCYFDKKYRGGSYKHYVLAYFRLLALLSHPFTPFLLVARYFSYLPYAQLAHTFEYVYPSYGKVTPDFIKAFIDDFARKVMSKGDEYDPKTSVLKQTRFYSLKCHASESWSANTKDTHVNFFCERNPGWTEGHQLVAVASIRLRDILVLMRRMIVKAKNVSQQAPRKTKILPRVSFQSQYANECAENLRGNNH